MMTIDNLLSEKQNLHKVLFCIVYDDIENFTYEAEEYDETISGEFHGRSFEYTTNQIRIEDAYYKDHDLREIFGHSSLCELIARKEGRL